MKVKLLIVSMLTFPSIVSAEVFDPIAQKRDYLGALIGTGWFAGQQIIQEAERRAKNFFYQTAKQSRTATQILQELIKARRQLGNEKLVEKLEAELEALLEQESLGVPVNFLAKKASKEEPSERQLLTPKQTVSVPGVRMAGGTPPCTPQKAKKASPASSATGPRRLFFADSEEDEPFVVASSQSGLDPSSNTPPCSRELEVYAAADGTPPSTPRKREAEVLDWKQKVQRGLRNLGQIYRNTLAMKKQGITEVTLKVQHWPEVCGPNHPFVGNEVGAVALRKWRESDTPCSFHEVSESLPNVSYLTDTQRAVCKVQIKNSQLTDVQGNLLKNVSKIFVIGPYGALYAGDDVKGQFHHSSFFAGAAVLWAGELRTNQHGQITYLSNESGHYQPGPEQTRNGLQVLQAQGVDLSQVRFEEAATFSSYNAQEYLNWLYTQFDATRRT